MADTVSKEKRSEIMSLIRAKNTKPEIAFRHALSTSLYPLGYRYRLHYDKVPGRPDIAFVRQKVAVFIHGCFWHRCPKCALKLPKSNRAFWRKKFARNQERDVRKSRELRAGGWRVAVVWECEVKKNPLRSVRKVVTMLRSRSA